MKNIWTKVSLILITGLLLVPLLSGVVEASSLQGGDGYKISPVRTDISINRGASQVVDLYVENVTKTPEDIQTLVDDFVANNNENGTPSLLLNGQAAPGHGLKQFIKVETPIFVLQPQQQQTVKILISIPKTAAPGGYYSAVRFAPSSFSGGRNVNLSASVASLILVTVPGNYLERMNISSFSVNSNGRAGSFFTSNKNLSAVVAFSNSGQAQEVPFGKIILLKGKTTLGTYMINTAQGNVLPNSVRKFSVNLKNVGSFGKYSVQGYFGYGNKGQLLSTSTSFYIVPDYLIVTFVIIVIILLLIAILLIRRLHRKTNSAKN